jgi:hypothetical protein
LVSSSPLFSLLFQFHSPSPIFLLISLLPLLLHLLRDEGKESEEKEKMKRKEKEKENEKEGAG